ncbi:Uma2 family endonuclease [Calothrix sp. FACHB-1219]|uniref:Uma2 family endonuclease n=1 Tax=unclassified Calothrix TaxID=2619626 RepID=UPI0016861671|nr:MULTISPECIES: Uma2 family endonuclease [unclassified Calothrix]MBD2203636.1 Uma2 family endonuclease [Calothrix sp. FACHB-168]MBD2219942.1 Uma2 family endonuclease [Calothrix sp. FACHB-1219]
MTQSLQKLVTFDEFVEFLKTQLENIRYELYDGDIIQMPQPKGKHEEIIAFLAAILGYEFVRLKLKYGISNKALVQSENKQSGYFPDVLVMNLANLVNEPRWQEESILIQPESIPLVIEVVSTNWRDDYHKKFADYEEMGIKEYWIVDYLALGSKLLIGDPKQPTITIYSLNNEGEYQGKQFRGTDRIESPTFPELNLTAQQIFQANNS